MKQSGLLPQSRSIAVRGPLEDLGDFFQTPVVVEISSSLFCLATQFVNALRKAINLDQTTNRLNLTNIETVF